MANRIFIRRSLFLIALVLAITVSSVYDWAQAPREFLDKSAPSPKTRLVMIRYEKSFDGTRGEALLELPASLDHPVPLIVTPNPAGWSQEMNRCLWSGVADQFNVMILYPRGQESSIPNASLGAPQQIENLESALMATEKSYPVDKTRVYAAGLSQGALEALLIAGNHPDQFAGVLSINPIADFIAFYQDLMAPETQKPEGLAHTAAADTPHPEPPSRAALAEVIAKDVGGTPDTERAAYYQRSSILYAPQLARMPLILYWATDDEVIPRGAEHQGGVLASLIRSFHPTLFEEISHQGGHGYPFFEMETAPPGIKLCPHDIFLNSVKKMLSWHRVAA